MRLRKHYPIALLLLLLVAIALSASLVTTNASATSTWTCGSCHNYAPGDAFHQRTTHSTTGCTVCHTGGITAAGLSTAACKNCHGMPAIQARASHVTSSCWDTVGCHGVTSPSPTPSSTSTPTPTPTPTATPVTPKITIKSALTVKVNRRIAISGKVTPTGLAGRSVKITIQKKSGTTWKTVKAVSAKISLADAYSYKYKPTSKGRYHTKAAIAAKAGVNKAASSSWRAFRVN